MLQKINSLARSMTLPSQFQVPSHEQLVDGLKKLAADFPDDLQLSFNGRSRNGKQLIFAEVGKADRVVAVTSGAHSDEPTGIATSFYFIQNLLRNSDFKTLTDKYKFIFHPMLDPDGAELNYTWASKDFSYYEYLKNNFRNNRPSEDCEHGIPASSDQVIRPELRFFKENVDRFKGRIDYYLTMHTTHRLGGSLFVISAKGDHQSRIETLTSVCENFDVPVIDMDLYGQDGIERVAPGFITAPPMAKMAEKFKDKPEVLAQIKMPTYEYVEHFLDASFCLISELPYIVDKNLLDKGVSTTDLIDVKKRDLEKRKQRVSRIQKAVAELRNLGVSSENPWFQNAEFTAQFAMAGISGEESQLDNYKGIKARNYDVTDVEVMDLESELKFHQLYIQSLRGRPEHKALFDMHNKAFDDAYERLESHIEYQVVPLATQVRVQAAMILSGLEF